MRQREVKNREDNCNRLRGLVVECGRNTERFLSRLVTLVAVLLLVMVFTTCHALDVSAYSATLTTGTDIKLNASPSGDGTSIHEESINVVSDCRSGYNLSIATPEGSNLYADGNTSNPATFTAVDGTSALNSTNNTNKWGYTLTTNPTSSTVFSPLSAAPTILKTSSQTASSTTDINDTFSINYGVKVNNTVTPGSYKMANNGSIVYYLTMDTTCTQYTVEFNPNGGTLVSGTTNPTQGIQTGEPTKLASADSLKAPTTSSYTDADNNTITGDSDKLWAFWGWNTQVDGTGDWYKDRESVTNLQQAGSTITLYAQWKQATLADMTAAPSTEPTDPKQISHNEMQDMRPEVCYNSPITTTENAPAATLLDYRGKVTTSESPESAEQYTVSKLADNNCWMTTNLNLGRTGTDGPNGNGTITLTSDDTDLAENTTFALPASNSAFTTGVTTVQLYNGDNNDGIYNSTYYGGYYSWAAAVARTTSLTSGSATTSICPKNWDLPTQVIYANLKTKGALSNYNNASVAPYNFTYGGYRNGSNFTSQTTRGDLWTATAYSSNYAYENYITSSAFATAGSGSTYYKYYGRSVRCVASNGTATINYDGNGTTEYPVTGTVATQENVEINSTSTQAGTGFTRAGWAFNGWNTAADGTGTAITAANASTTSLVTLGLKPGETITLYAQWMPQYTITYVNNCQTYASTNSACTQSVSDGTSEQKINLTNNPSTGTETGTLAAYNKWTLTGWKIKGWSTVADNSDNTNTEYGVGTTYTVPAGSSVGSGITLYAHWVPVYSIQYDGNNADNPNGMGTIDQSTGVKSVKQTNVGEGDPVTLLASNFKKPGYGFAGWSTDPDAYTHFTDNDNTNDSIIYGPMETIDAPAYPTNGTNIITMYAVWVAAEKDTNDDPVYLQDFTASDCNALTKADFNTSTGVITPGSVIALTDKRDDEVYTVAKLADDNCWMIENLRLEHEGTVGNNKNDSTVTNQSLSQGYGGTPGTYGNFVGLANPESANFSNSTTSLSFADGGIYKSSSASPTDTYNSSTSTLEDIGTSNYPGFRFPRYNNSNISSALQSPTYTENYTNAASPSTSGTYKTSTVSSYGNYYTWAAAMANTNYYTSPTSTDASGKTSENVGTSICPTNWHLPSSSTTTKEYGVLSQRYGGTGSNLGIGDIMSNRFRSFPNNFLYSGNFNGSSASDRGSYGGYWSRSANSYSDSYSLYLRSTLLSPSYYYGKNCGFSVRCLIGS